MAWHIYENILKHSTEYDDGNGIVPYAMDGNGKLIPRVKVRVTAQYVSFK